MIPVSPPWDLTLLKISEISSFTESSSRCAHDMPFVFCWDGWPPAMADFFCVQVQHNRSKPVTQLLGQLEVGYTETQDFPNMIPRSHVHEQDFVYCIWQDVIFTVVDAVWRPWVHSTSCRQCCCNGCQDIPRGFHNKMRGLADCQVHNEHLPGLHKLCLKERRILSQNGYSKHA